MAAGKLFLLDAYALIYRAHFAFAKNPRITSKGLNTSAVFGFLNTLLEVLNKEKPTHIGVAFDMAGPTIRHESFDQYKANRAEQPEDITLAVPYIHKLLEGFNIPILCSPGYEADDVIGTLAKKAEAEGFEVYMMTPDKDYCQLVSENIFVYKPAIFNKGPEILGVKEVLEKWEISRIDQVIDILGLQGDAVDNIPGIPGIGEKTAKKLIAEYDTVENLIANVGQLKGKMAENVANFADQGLQSKQLATILLDAPVDFDADALKLDEPNKAALKPLFEELEFRTIARRILGEEVGAPPTPRVSSTGQINLFGQEQELVEITPVKVLASAETTDHLYHICNTEQRMVKLANWLVQLKSFCFDTETNDIDANEAELVGLSFSWTKGEAYYVPVPEDFEAAKTMLQLFKPAWEDASIRKVGQNLKFDMLVLKKYDIHVQGEIYDTMLAHYLLEPDQRHGMDFMAEQFLQYSPIKIDSLIGKKGKNQGTMRDVELSAIAEYAGEDADITWQLHEILAPKVQEAGLESLLLDVEAPLVNVLTEMEYEGITIDTSVLGELSELMANEAKVIEAQIYEVAGETFNIASPAQLGRILFDKMKLDDKAKKTKTGQYATGEEILSKLADEHPIAALILEYRELQKLKSTYIDALPELISKRDGRVHTSFNQAVAATGRLSSTNPNLQNIPIRTARGREIRKAFVPRSSEFTILSADYSQIELRIMAAFSKDETMIEAFKQGKDIHAITASKLYKVPLEDVTSDMRRKAKTANFGIIYGISAFGLSQRLSIPRKEAAEIIDNYFIEFPNVKAYMDDVVNQAREREYVTTILGRRRYLPNINSRNITDRGFAERNAINAPIQGSAADMIKKAMINIHHWMKSEGLKSRMVLQVHDELVFDAHLSEVELLKTKVEELMRTAIDLPVPMEIGLGTGANWLDAH